MLRWFKEHIDLRHQQKLADHANEAAAMMMMKAEEADDYAQMSIANVQVLQENYLAVQIADMMLETKEAQAEGNLMEHLDKIAALVHKYGVMRSKHLENAYALMSVVVDRSGHLGVSQPTFPSSLGDK